MSHLPADIHKRLHPLTSPALDLSAITWDPPNPILMGKLFYHRPIIEVKALGRAHRDEGREIFDPDQDQPL